MYLQRFFRLAVFRWVLVLVILGVPLSLLLLAPKLEAISQPPTLPRLAMPNPATATSTPTKPPAAYGQLPLIFEQNNGQTDPSVRYLARGGGYQLFLTNEAAVFSYAASADSATRQVVRMKWAGAGAGAGAGANPASGVQGLEPTTARTNYFTGARAYSDLANYKKIEYSQIYAGIDLTFYGSPNQLEYDFIVHPQADPDQIRLTFEGLSGLEIEEESGDLILQTVSGDLVHKAPYIYQPQPGGATTVKGSYKLLPQADGLPQVGFTLGEYDATKPLVIDPLVYSSYLGNGGTVTQARGVTLDLAGNAYLVGYTDSVVFPTTIGNSLAGGRDVFVTKVNPAGSELLYSTFVGGSADDLGLAIAVSGAGLAYVTGETLSDNFPTTPGTIQPSDPQIGGKDAFIFYLTATGTLSGSTYYGGNGADSANRLVLAGSNVYIAGESSSSTLPGNANSFAPSSSGPSDAFLFIMNQTLVNTGFSYATFFGGTDTEAGSGLAVTSSGRVYLGGATTSANLPLVNAADNSLGGTDDGFLARINPVKQGAADLEFATYIGGDGKDALTALTLTADAPVVAGRTDANAGFSMLATSPQSYGGGVEGFVLKFNSNPQTVSAGTYLGGSGEDIIRTIAHDAADPNGAYVVAGYTLSPNFPTTNYNAFQLTSKGDKEGFVTRLASADLTLAGSSYIGGSAADDIYSVAVDGKSYTYIAGETFSGDWTITPGAYQKGLLGSSSPNALFGKLDLYSRNLTWVFPQTLPASLVPVTATRYYGQADNSFWYKVNVPPDSQITVTLKGRTGATLPADLDITLHRDVAEQYNTLLAGNNQENLEEQTAQAAPFSFTPFSFTPFSFTPFSFTPFSFTPFSFTPFSFTGFGGLGEDGWNLLYNSENSPPPGFSQQPDAYVSAVDYSLVAVSAQPGQGLEQISHYNYDAGGDYYIRVRSFRDAASATDEFELGVQVQPGACSALPAISGTSPPPPNPSASQKTVILTMPSRMPGTSLEKAAMLSKLNQLAARPEVAGVVINLDDAAYGRVQSAQAIADSFSQCAYARNLTAAEIKRVIDSYRQTNLPGTPLSYIVLVGGDFALPFVRTLDKSGYGEEKDFYTPLQPLGSAYAALRTNLVLSQDAYGTRRPIKERINLPFVPDLPVGRLVESPTDVMKMVDAYLLTPDGIVTPQSGYVAGYDFIADAAQAVKTEMEAGLNPPGCSGDCYRPTTLISQSSDPTQWSANDLRNTLLPARHDLIFLAGHFSAGYAQAADATTVLGASEIVASEADFTNALIFSLGCHSGYSISPQDTIAPFSEEPDWAQAFAKKGMTAVIGTGFQYGDTELVEYSERLYLNFVNNLRTRPAGQEAVPVGRALVAAKQRYLAGTSPVNGMHEKVMQQATLYGLPFLQIKMTARPPVSDTSSVSTTSNVISEPGLSLGLEVASLTVTPSLTVKNRVLTSTVTGLPSTATYLEGSNGVASNGLDMLLPLEVSNVNVPGLTLRGVGFRGGTFQDTANIFPLTGGSSSEYGRTRMTFETPNFYPTLFWGLNNSERLVNQSGNSRLRVTPAQYVSSAEGSLTGTLRRYTNLNFKLFYSANTGNAAKSSAPALETAEAFAQGTSANITVKMRPAGAAGIQEIWLTYYWTGSNQWLPLDLTQSPTQPNIWTATLPLGSNSANQLRFMVHAASGTGLVTVAHNDGKYYQASAPRGIPNPTQATNLRFDQFNSQTTFLEDAPIRVFLTKVSNADPIAGEPVRIQLGAQVINGVTNAQGQIWVTPTIQLTPGEYVLSISYDGSVFYKPAYTTAKFTVARRPTTLSYVSGSNGAVLYGQPTTIIAQLQDSANRKLGQKTVVFVGTGLPGTFAAAVKTDAQGQARLNAPQWPAGAYSVRAYFGGNLGQFGVFTDTLFLPSATSLIANFSLTINKRSATLEDLTGGTINQSNPKAIVRLKQFTGIPAGSIPPGNPSLGVISVTVKNQLGAVISVNSAPADPSGRTIVPLANISPAPGQYTLEYRLVSDYYITAGSDVPVQTASCLTVTLSSDSGQGECGSLTQAIVAANAYSGVEPSVTISFAPGITQVVVNTPLPRLGHATNKSILLRGSCVGGVPQMAVIAGANVEGDGLRLADKVTVTGLIVRGFSGYAIDVAGSDNEITCNELGNGSNPTQKANGGGIRLGATNSANNNRLGRADDPASGNRIAGNTGYAILVLAGTGNSASYNAVGYRTDNNNATLPQPNTGGVRVQSGGQLTFRIGNRIVN